MVSDDEDLHGARHGLDMELGAGGAEYEVAATRLKEPDAVNDREAGNQNTMTGVQRVRTVAACRFRSFCTYLFHLYALVSNLINTVQIKHSV